MVQIDISAHVSNGVKNYKIIETSLLILQSEPLELPLQPESDELIYKVLSLTA